MAAFNVYIGHDDREDVAFHVCAHSITRHTQAPVTIIPVKHRDMRTKGYFRRPWLIDSDTGLYRDLIDNKPFSTQFSHTRFLVPFLNDYKGWALFMDSDMVFTGDVKELLTFCDDRYAALVVKHNHKPAEAVKMDNQPQARYYRKNWSSFVLWNCAHPANKFLTPAKVNTLTGTELHGFCWLSDNLIGHLGWDYNWIEGASPHVKLPKVIHYTEGGPWFDECKDVMHGDIWTDEYERWQRSTSSKASNVLTTKHDYKV